MTLRRLVPLGALLLLVFSVSAWGWTREGSDWRDLQRQKPPAPQQLRVAVLPFWAKAAPQAEQVRGAVLLNLRRHGFQITPAAPSLAQAGKATAALLEADKEREPGARTDRALAVRVGKAAGASWVVYGEVEQLRVDVSHTFFSDRKTGTIDMRLVVASVDSGQIVYWARVHDTWGSRVYARKAAGIERQVAVATVGTIFDDLSKALPQHTVGPAVSDNDVLSYVEQMGL